jgi:cytochrome P450 family 6
MLAEFTDNLLASQAFIFFLAGFETSSTTLSFCLHELAVNSQIQERLREEIDSTLKKSEGKITYDGLQNMPYLDQVLDGEKYEESPFCFSSQRTCLFSIKPHTEILTF